MYFPSLNAGNTHGEKRLLRFSPTPEMGGCEGQQNPPDGNQESPVNDAAQRAQQALEHTEDLEMQYIVENDFHIAMQSITPQDWVRNMVLYAYEGSAFNRNFIARFQCDIRNLGGTPPHYSIRVLRRPSPIDPASLYPLYLGTNAPPSAPAPVQSTIRDAPTVFVPEPRGFAPMPQSFHGAARPSNPAPPPATLQSAPFAEPQPRHIDDFDRALAQQRPWTPQEEAAHERANRDKLTKWNLKLEADAKNERDAEEKIRQTAQEVTRIRNEADSIWEAHQALGQPYDPAAVNALQERVRVLQVAIDAIRPRMIGRDVKFVGQWNARVASMRGQDAFRALNDKVDKENTARWKKENEEREKWSEDHASLYEQMNSMESDFKRLHASPDTLEIAALLKRIENFEDVLRKAEIPAVAGTISRWRDSLGHMRSSVTTYHDIPSTVEMEAPHRDAVRRLLQTLRKQNTAVFFRFVNHREIVVTINGTTSRIPFTLAASPGGPVMPVSGEWEIQLIHLLSAATGEQAGFEKDVAAMRKQYDDLVGSPNASAVLQLRGTIENFVKRVRSTYLAPFRTQHDNLLSDLNGMIAGLTRTPMLPQILRGNNVMQASNQKIVDDCVQSLSNRFNWFAVGGTTLFVSIDGVVSRIELNTIDMPQRQNGNTTVFRRQISGGSWEEHLIRILRTATGEQAKLDEEERENKRKADAAEKTRQEKVVNETYHARGAVAVLRGNMTEQQIKALLMQIPGAERIPGNHPVAHTLRLAYRSPGGQRTITPDHLRSSIVVRSGSLPPEQVRILGANAVAMMPNLDAASEKRAEEHFSKLLESSAGIVGFRLRPGATEPQRKALQERVGALRGIHGIAIINNVLVMQMTTSADPRNIVTAIEADPLVVDMADSVPDALARAVRPRTSRNLGEECFNLIQEHNIHFQRDISVSVRNIYRQAMPGAPFTFITTRDNSEHSVLYTIWHEGAERSDPWYRYQVTPQAGIAGRRSFVVHRLGRSPGDNRGGLVGTAAVEGLQKLLRDDLAAQIPLDVEIIRKQRLSLR